LTHATRASLGSLAMKGATKSFSSERSALHGDA